MGCIYNTTPRSPSTSLADLHSLLFHAFVNSTLRRQQHIWLEINMESIPLTSSLLPFLLPAALRSRPSTRRALVEWPLTLERQRARGVWRPAFDTRRNSTSLSRPSLNNTCSAILNDGIFPIWTNIYPTHSFQFPFFLSRTNIFQDKKKRKFFKQSRDIF